MQSGLLINCFRLLLLAFLAGSVSACSPKTDPRFDQRGTAPEGNHDIYHGPLKQAFRSVQDSPFREKCDAQNAEIQKKLISALDQNQSAILKSSMTLQNSAGELVPLGKFNLVQQPKRIPKKGWQKEVYGWELIADYFEKNVDKNLPEFWSKVDTYVRSLITDDRKRVVYGYNLDLDHSEIEQLPVIQETLESCMTDTRCSHPEWNEEQSRLLSSVPAYQHFQSAIEKSLIKNEKRKILTKFLNRISADIRLHEMEFNPMISHKPSDGIRVFEVPFDSGLLSEKDRTLLEKAMLSIWKNTSNSFQISWKNPSSTLDYFKFILNPEPNNRSFVNFNLREVHLFPFTRLRTVAHEFGHVLGFADHYYTLWDENRCVYYTEFNEEDLMSDSDSGEVTEAEWKSIIELYENR